MTEENETPQRTVRAGVPAFPAVLSYSVRDDKVAAMNADRNPISVRHNDS